MADPKSRKAYVLTFRCVNCGRPEVSVSSPCEASVPVEQVKTQIYKANCKACGWRGDVCGVSAVSIHYAQSRGA